jgi:hypothetical protein
MCIYIHIYTHIHIYRYGGRPTLSNAHRAHESSVSADNIRDELDEVYIYVDEYYIDILVAYINMYTCICVYKFR